LRCHTWKFPSKVEDEISLDILKKLPEMAFANITGGEPFLRKDINEIGRIISDRCKRATIVTGGYFTKKVLEFSKKNPSIGIRVSLEGLPTSSNKLRGLPKGYDHSMRTLIELAETGLKDLGFSITISDENYKDLMPLYNLSRHLNWEFATAVVHNSYYFHKMDNEFECAEKIKKEFYDLMEAFLESKKVKNWYRAWFVGGIINKVDNLPRLLKCSAATNIFYLDPFGGIHPCNVLEDSLGNLNQASFEEIWHSKHAAEVRHKVDNCDKHCWMIGSVADRMKANIHIPTKWVLKNKWNLMRKKRIELPCPPVDIKNHRVN
jgi:MoaA/NifB/PqqE/SkfB family radical SAM enzyme